MVQGVVLVIIEIVAKPLLLLRLKKPPPGPPKPAPGPQKPPPGPPPPTKIMTPPTSIQGITVTSRAWGYFFKQPQWEHPSNQDRWGRHSHTRRRKPTVSASSERFRELTQLTNKNIKKIKNYARPLIVVKIFDFI